ncbi:MAG: guanylate kinase [Proteobacteria bacterium]|jgi:guanylate kinase|nr:guanylate kinase [Pseudomonadota bacterium]
MTESGHLYVIAAPSGGGKTSLVKALLAAEPQLALSVSHTTRPPRPNELDGREYHFVTPEVFAQRVLADGFLEHAQVFDNHYGTGREQVEAQLAAGRNVILEIDWQGARQVRQARPDTRSIFILPPSLATLRQRLEGRATDSPQVIARRLADAQGDMSHCLEFDYAVINDDFGRALADLQQIIAGHGASLRADRPELSPLLANLLA